MLAVKQGDRVSRVKSYIRLAAAAVIAIGLATMIGWQIGVPVLARIIPAWVPMMPNTAASLIALGIGLWCSTLTQSPVMKLMEEICGWVAMLVGGLTLTEYIAQINLGLDLLLPFTHQPQLPVLSPGRMAHATAFSLLLCGVALVLRKRPVLPQICASVSLFIALTALMGYVFGANALYSVSIYSAMAVNTATALFLISAGLLAAVPYSKLVELLTSSSAGGTAARTLLLSIPVIVLGIGSILLTGEEMGYFEGRFSLALMATLSISVLVLVSLRTARKLHRIDEARQRSQQLLSALNAELEQRVNERTSELERTNARLVGEIEQRQRVEDEARRLSLTDELTGVHNRRSFFLLAEQMLRSARRTECPCLLFFIDLDGLKKINDANGHEAGDLAIIAAAQVLKAAFRDSDVVARIGGDEFVALAMDAGVPADRITARIRTLVEEFNDSDRCRYPIALSIGVVECSPKELKPLSELLARADALMYADKQLRRSAKANPVQPELS